MNKIEIYGTLGPSCKDYETLKSMLELGMTGIRLNLSHCNLWDKKDWIDAYIKAKQEVNKNADLLIDMHGPELRVRNITDSLKFVENTIIKLDNNILPYEVIKHAEHNDKILFDDGKIKIIVEDKTEYSLYARVLRGGHLKNNKGIAIAGKNIQGDILTSLDIENLKAANQFGVTGIMQPFVNDKESLIELNKTLKSLELDNLKIYAKIENSIGFENLEDIIHYCDYIVIARGDLGNAYGLTVLPVIQHRIEEICKKNNKPYMVVTQMLDSMHENSVPTRAEMSDIFHAVYNGAASIMLTGETASGKHPIEAMKYFSQTAYLALKERKEF